MQHRGTELTGPALQSHGMLSKSGGRESAQRRLRRLSRLLRPRPQRYFRLIHLARRPHH